MTLLPFTFFEISPKGSIKEYQMLVKIVKDSNALFCLGGLLPRTYNKNVRKDRAVEKYLDFQLSSLKVAKVT